MLIQAAIPSQPSEGLVDVDGALLVVVLVTVFVVVRVVLEELTIVPEVEVGAGVPPEQAETEIVLAFKMKYQSNNVRALQSPLGLLAG